MNRRSSNPLVNFALLALGSALAAFAVEEFLVPNTILDGGVIGIGIMISHLTNLPLSLLTVLLNAPFVIIGGLKLGRGFTVRAVFSMAVFSACVELFSGWATATDETLLAVCFGGVLLGLGVGIVIHQGGCLDGTEAVAILLSRRTDFAVGQMVLGMNVVIYTVAGVLFGTDRALYSLLTYFITSKIIDMVESEMEQAKAALIITDDADEICNKIYRQMGRTVTIMNVEGMITGSKKMLYCVITKFEIRELRDVIDSVDQSAFVTILDVSEIIGNHIKSDAVAIGDCGVSDAACSSGSTNGGGSTGGNGALGNSGTTGGGEEAAGSR